MHTVDKVILGILRQRSRDLWGLETALKEVGIILSPEDIRDHLSALRDKGCIGITEPPDGLRFWTLQRGIEAVEEEQRADW